jgi:uncharacterized protein
MNGRSFILSIFFAVTLSLGVGRTQAGAQVGDTTDVRLLRAAEKGDLKGVREALGSGANPDVTNSEGLSALELADMRQGNIGSLSDRVPSMKAANARLDIIKLLLDRGAKLRQVEKEATFRDELGRALVTDALHFSRYDVAEMLVKADAPPDAVNLFSVVRAHPWTRKPREQRKWFDRTLSDERVKDWSAQALCEASASPDAVYFVRRLLEAGVDVNARSYTGHTPLTFAVSQGKTEVVKLLLEHGAAPNLPYRAPKSDYLVAGQPPDGKTPLTLATEKRNKAVVGLLKKAGARG